MNGENAFEEMARRYIRYLLAERCQKTYIKNMGTGVITPVFADYDSFNEKEELHMRHLKKLRRGIGREFIPEEWGEDWFDHYMPVNPGENSSYHDFSDIVETEDIE